MEKNYLLFVLILFVFGCNKDNIDDYTNYFKYGNQTYEIKTCAVFMYYFNDSAGLFDIRFYDADIEFMKSDSGFIPTNLMDGLNEISFQSCRFDEEIKNGLYLAAYFQSPYGGYPKEIGFFTSSQIGFNYNTINESFENRTTFGAGNISINKNGLNNKFEFDCIDLNGSKVRGRYSGEIREYKFNYY